MVRNDIATVHQLRATRAQMSDRTEANPAIPPSSATNLHLWAVGAWPFIAVGVPAIGFGLKGDLEQLARDWQEKGGRRATLCLRVQHWV